ncbi:MAG: hypothetical protein M5T61_18795 [Acidimicrobiia bacterium]|nr:hypothetical protein [Acidimicrobiia bacterium]
MPIAMTRSYAQHESGLTGNACCVASVCTPRSTQAARLEPEFERSLAVSCPARRRWRLAPLKVSPGKLDHEAR